MLEKHAPDATALATAVMHYRLNHQADFQALRVEGAALLAAMSPAERTAFETRHRGRAVPLQGQLEALAKRYPDARLAMRLVRPLLVSPAPTGPRWQGGDPPWLPPLPEGVTETPMRDPHDHGHGSGVPEAPAASEAPSGP